LFCRDLEFLSKNGKERGKEMAEAKENQGKIVPEIKKEGRRKSVQTSAQVKARRTNSQKRQKETTKKDEDILEKVEVKPTQKNTKTRKKDKKRY